MQEGYILPPATMNDTEALERRIEEALAEVDAAKLAFKSSRAAADQQALQLAVAELNSLRSSLRNARQRQPPKSQSSAASLFYPSAVLLPRDADDDRWVQSFEVSDGAAACSFYKEYGFVVFREVLDADECAKTRSEMWKFLEDKHEGFSRADASTWSIGFSRSHYGLPGPQASFTAQLVANRQHPRVYAAFDAVLPCCAHTAGGHELAEPGPNSLIMSHDRWCIYLPSAEHPEWKTPYNLHLDLCPWSYFGDAPSGLDSLTYAQEQWPLQDFRAEINCVTAEKGPHCQGVLNLFDNDAGDGGTCIVPQFHKHFSKWYAALGPIDDYVNKTGDRDNRVLRRNGGGGSFRFSDHDPIHKLAQRVPMRAGSLLIWNQELVHGSKPNDSTNLRMAQFVRAFRAGTMRAEHARARAKAVRRELDAAGLLPELAPLAPHVFGFTA